MVKGAGKEALHGGGLENRDKVAQTDCEAQTSKRFRMLHAADDEPGLPCLTELAPEEMRDAVFPKDRRDAKAVGRAFALKTAGATGQACIQFGQACGLVVKKCVLQIVVQILLLIAVQVAGRGDGLQAWPRPCVKILGRGQAEHLAEMAVDGPAFVWAGGQCNRASGEIAQGDAGVNMIAPPIPVAHGEPGRGFGIQPEQMERRRDDPQPKGLGGPDALGQ